MFQTKVVENIKTHILCSVTFLPENSAFYEIMCENMYSRAGNISQYGAYAMNAG
jgi:hypothetical protein